MTDIFDRAQALELLERETILMQHAAKQSNGMGLSHCQDCGEEIPILRQQCVRGCTRCIDCQVDFEKWGKR